MKEERFEFRLSTADKKNLLTLAEKFGYENNLSAFIRRRCFERELVYEDIQGKIDICQAINKIDININQSVKSINTIAKKSKLNKKDYEDLNTNISNLLLLQKDLINLVDQKLFVTHTKEVV